VSEPRDTNVEGSTNRAENSGKAIPGGVDEPVQRSGYGTSSAVVRSGYTLR